MRKLFLIKLAIFAFSFFIATSSPVVSQESYAQSGGASAAASSNAFTKTLCNALNIITGTGGKAFAAFAIISLGIGFFTGKVSWGLMIGVTAGIAAMFGAPTIVQAIAGGNAVNCAASGGDILTN